MCSALKKPTVEVSSSRLAHGKWCHRTNKMIGEGDVSASYSADRIGSEKPVRKPFSQGGKLWVCTGSNGKTSQAYRLVHPACFDGNTLTYGERVRDGYNGRSDPKGFYHGMLVTHRGEAIVLCGPEIHFVAGAEQQGNLFDF